MKTRTFDQSFLLFAATVGLFALLSYNFVHTGGLLSRYVRPAFVGYLAAFGVELIVATTSWRLAMLKRTRTKNRPLLFTLVAALILSAFANISEGYHEQFTEPLRWANIGQIDPIQAIIGLSATALMSVLVFAVSEIIGVDTGEIVRRIEREQRTSEATERPKRQPKPETKPETKLEPANYEPMVYGYIAERTNNGEDIPGPTEIANAIGCSKATASKWANKWQTQGRLQKNGHGWQVIE